MEKICLKNSCHIKHRETSYTPYQSRVKDPSLVQDDKKIIFPPIPMNY